MFNMFPQQNFADMLKALAFRGARRGGKKTILNAVKRLENARIWDVALFAQAIDQVKPGAIWGDASGNLYVAGGASTLTQIVDVYLQLTGEVQREVV